MLVMVVMVAVEMMGKSIRGYFLGLEEMLMVGVVEETMAEVTWAEGIWEGEIFEE